MAKSVAEIERGNSDDEVMSALYKGLNQSQLMKLFRLDNRTIKAKIFESGVKPIGRVYHADIYSVYELAPYLVKPVGDIEAYIKRMDHSDLPKHLTKEFWAGQRSRQDYEEKAGLLWRTERVVEEVGELMKLVKMSTLLMLDAVERQTELSDRQREIIRSLSHGMLSDLQQRVDSKFKVPNDVQHQEEVSDEEL